MSTYTPPDSPLSDYTLLHDDDGYTIRAMTSNDIPAACMLYSKLQPGAPVLPPSFLIGILHNPTHVALLAFSSESNTPVGVLTAALHKHTSDLSSKPLPPRLDVLVLGVLPSHRRRGLGARLVSAAARRLGAERVRAEVRGANEEGRAFWKGFGCEEEIEARPWRMGSWGDVVRLEGEVQH